jgi:hypothetical protein
MSTPSATNCQTSYDQVADEYIRRIFDELQHKPLDRQLLARFATEIEHQSRRAYIFARRRECSL